MKDRDYDTFTTLSKSGMYSRLYTNLKRYTALSLVHDDVMRAQITWKR